MHWPKPSNNIRNSSTCRSHTCARVDEIFLQMCLAHILACTWKNVAVACAVHTKKPYYGVCVVQLTQGLNVVGSCGVLLRIFTSSSNCFLLKMSCHSGNIYSCPYLYLLLFIFASCSKGSSCLAFSSLTNLLFFAFFWKSTLQQFFPYQSKKTLKFAKQIFSLVSL